MSGVAESVKFVSNRVTDGIVERVEHDTLILAPTHGRVRRRVLHVNAYGGRHVWEQIKNGQIPTHQLLGCLEIVRAGYEVALAEPVPGWFNYRRPFPHDFGLLRLIRRWLGPDDVVF